MDRKPHVVVIPFPAQGHVMPLTKLSCCLADRGFRVTFVSTESIHAKLIDSLPKEGNEEGEINIVAIHDGLTSEERNHPTTSFTAVQNNLPVEFEKLIKSIMESNENKITCVIADETVGWALEVAKKMGIRGASFFPASAGMKALAFNITKLIEKGLIDDNGNMKKNETFHLSPSMPAMETRHLVWQLGDSHLQQLIFQCIQKHNQVSQTTDWVLCNSSDHLEQAAITLVPNLLSVGPLLSSKQLGNLWPEDPTCLSWLNQQSTSSVIYVAFGSIAAHNQYQFDELALGLELLGLPFLWVVRAGEGAESIYSFPNGFQERVAHLGKIVAWAPQLKVLAHPSIACFISHCGWNSTLDGVSMGVPFIAWPSFSDQFCNQTYITDVWKVGLSLKQDGNGTIPREEIQRKVIQLLGDKLIRENALNLKQMTINSVSKGGSSFNNFEQFLEEMKR